MFRYIIDISLSTHDDLRAGNTAARVDRIFLLLDSINDAFAVQFACGAAHHRAGGDFLPTGAALIDFPIDGPTRAPCSRADCHRCAKSARLLA